jgi:zinc protease
MRYRSSALPRRGAFAAAAMLLTNLLLAAALLVPGAPIAVASAGPAAPAQPAASAAAPVVKEILPNGLTLLLQPDHSKPLVGVCLFVNGGSRTETPTLSGLSHYYEHLIFRGGSLRQGELEFRKEMQRIGEESGGYTTNDYTCYGFTAPTPNLDETLWRSVDAWLGLKLTQAKVDRERQVVMEEYNQGEDRPDYKVYYQIERLMFRDHAYKRDTIGLKDAIQNSTLATFRTFYAERYVPNQMILAVVGDFDVKAMRSKLAKAFAPYRRGKDNFELGIAEGPQTEFRMGAETMKTPSTWTYLGFHVPPYSHPDAPALTVVASLLGRGHSSRLYRALKDKENLVTEVSADFEVRRDPGMFTVSTQMPPANEARVFGIVRDELVRLAAEPISAAELARVKSALLNEYAYNAQTHFHRAERLCLFALMSDVSMAAQWPKLLESVTAEDVRRITRNYLGADQASYSVVRPADAAGGPSEGDVHAMVASWRQAWPAAGAARAVTASAPRKEVLPNGITLILKEDHATPIVAGWTFARGGQWIEPEGLSGVSNMAAILLRRGAGSMTARDISERAEGLGMRLASGGGADFATVSWQAPSGNLEKAWEIYRAVLTQPTFPSSEVAKVREDLIRQVKSLGDRPFEYTNLKFAQVLYRTSPYRRFVGGDESSLGKITVADLRKAYETMFCGANLVVSITGDFDSERLLALARKTLGSVRKGAPVVVSGGKEAPASSKNPTFEQKDQEQVTYNTGWLACSILDPDYVPLRAGVAVIGDKLFFKYVYEKGVAYRSWFYMADRLAQSSAQNEMGVTPANFAMASSGVLEDITAMVRGPLSSVDLKRSVDKLLSRYYLGAQENDDVAYRLGYYEAAGLGWEFSDRYPETLRTVTAEQVSAVMKRYLNPATFTRVAVGKEAEKTAATSAAPGR